MAQPDPITEAREELAALLQQWSYAACFPQGYTGSTSVAVTTDIASDVDANIVPQANGMPEYPFISIVGMLSPETHKTLGDVDPSQVGVAQGKTRYSRAVNAHFIVACWADLQVGGGDMADALAGQVWSAVLQNRNSLTAFRRLKAEPGRLAFNDSAQLWTRQLVVSGIAIASFDA